MMGKQGRGFLFVWTLVVILITTWPWSDFRGHSHWYHVVWIPFSDVSVSLSSFLNISGNIIFFIPFGIVSAKFHPTAPQGILLWSILLSLGIELFQVYCHNHFPSTTDFFSNVMGAVFGTVCSNRVYGRNEPE